LHPLLLQSSYGSLVGFVGALVSHKRAVGSSTEAAGMSESISGFDRWEFWNHRGSRLCLDINQLYSVYSFVNVLVNIL
jgi:hypothetical protein